MPILPFDRARLDALLQQFGDATKGDPKGIDPADDTTAEFAYLALAVKLAGPRFRLLALGAAPGEWALRAERLHRRLHPAGDYRSLNIEGDIGHVEMMRQFFAKHGADLEANAVRYAVVSARDGYAYFPVINPEIDWGAAMAAWAERPEDLSGNITMTEAQKLGRISANGGKPLEFQTVPAIALSTMLQEIGRVDCIHCDIQGHEGDIFPANMLAMNEHARIACIATHSALIEAKLREVFAQHGWDLECAFPFRDGRDGTFVWSNPRISDGLSMSC